MKPSLPLRTLVLETQHLSKFGQLTSSLRFKVIKKTSNSFVLQHKSNSRYFSNTKIFTMSSSFSNTDTGSKNPDPYKEKNLDHASIEEKVTDLGEFVSACKFGMMTTRDESSGMLVSRCMALAAKVYCKYSLLENYNSEAQSSTYNNPSRYHYQEANVSRNPAVSTSSFTPTPNLAKLTTWNPTPTLTSLSWTAPVNGHPYPVLPLSRLTGSPSKNIIALPWRPGSVT